MNWDELNQKFGGTTQPVNQQPNKPLTSSWDSFNSNFIKPKEISIPEIPAGVESFGGTLSTLESLQKDPLSLKADPRESLIAYSDTVLETLKQEGENIKNLFIHEKEPLSATLGKELKVIAGAGSVIFSPISGLFAAADKIPVLGSISKLISLPFSVAGEGTALATNKIIDALPIPQETKENIKPGLSEITALAAQLAVGKVADIGMKKMSELRAKYGAKDAQIIADKAKEIATQQKQPAAVPIVPLRIENMRPTTWETFNKEAKVKPTEIKPLDPLAQEATKYKSAEEFVKGQTKSNSWSEAQKTNPDLFNTGILRKSQAPYKAKGEIPKDIHTVQGKWQNYGQNAEIPADKVYEKTDRYGYYLDKEGNSIKDNRTGEFLVSNKSWDDHLGEVENTFISNKQLRDEFIQSFSTPEGKKYLNEVIKALPKNPDGTITAYRIGNISGEGAQSYTLSEGMAKTFSNQGTDILPAGTPGLPRAGYKDFGALPVNTVKIDPKGIRAWNPYDAEILVEPKYVQTKSQLTDIWEKANKPEVKVSKVAKDINTELAKSGFEKLPETELSTYTPTTKQFQINEIAKILKMDIDAAKRMALGEEPVPAGIKSQPLFNAVEQYALSKKDVDLLKDLARSPVATQRSLLAQELGAAGFNNLAQSPVEAMAEIGKIRAKQVKNVDKVRKTSIDEVRKEIKKQTDRTLTQEAWSSFIKEITC